MKVLESRKYEISISELQEIGQLMSSYITWDRIANKYHKHSNEEEKMFFHDAVVARSRIVNQLATEFKIFIHA